MSAESIPGAVALVAASVAVVTDLRQGKIYNWLTLPLLGLAPFLQALVHGAAGFKASLAGAAGMIIAFGFLHVLIGPGLGGGDLKLLTALAALLGWPTAGWLLLWTALSGVLLIVPVTLRQGILLEACRNLWINLLRRRLGEKELSVSAGSLGPRLPYACCILCGTAAVLLIGFPGRP